MKLSARTRGGSPSFSWRLVALNGRSIAASARDFAAASSAANAFADLVERIDDMVLTVTHAPDRAGWLWVLHDADGSAQTRAPRPYERHDSCLRSARLTLDALRMLRARHVAESAIGAAEGGRDANEADVV